ncbi:hypothetical protein FA13DRAFT_1513892 [Coprinellus micaceus]|uniref:F-box domain-containing protein n=1 Tax=Coprinellus micaceus TaxID=71717 RepID=A0A4Y7SKM5_COPMI|nr:hypothetical protein FA13DRAFT_1513892 [Coprinellus micaceus]
MLTTLTVECGWDSPFIVSLLRAEDLTLNLRHCKYICTQTTDPIRLPQVRSICLQNPNPQGVRETVKLLHLPSLVRIDIIFPSTNSYINDQPLKQVVDALRFLALSRPAPRIRYLALERARDDADFLSAVLSVFPFLEHLVIDSFEFTGFPKRGNIGQLLPTLQKLEIRSVYDNFDLASFLLYINPCELPSVHRVVTGEAGNPPGEPDALRQVVLGYNSWANSTNIQAAWNENSSMLKALNDDFGVKVLKSRES